MVSLQGRKTSHSSVRKVDLGGSPKYKIDIYSTILDWLAQTRMILNIL